MISKSGVPDAEMSRVVLTEYEAEMKARKRARVRARWISLLLFAVLCVVGWPFFKAHLQAVAVLDLVAGQPVPRLIRHAVGEPVNAHVVTIETSQGPIAARLYTPVHHPNAPAFLVLHGVHHLGMEEPRLIAFASAMASCGLRVLTPELPGIKDYHVGPDSIAIIGDSAKWLAERNVDRSREGSVALPASQPVGVMGLSFAGGLALMAASEPEYRDYFRFVVAIGSQDSMSRVATYYRTGKDPLPNGLEETLPPHEYGPLVLEYENLQDFVPGADVATMRAMLRAHLYEDGPGERTVFAAMTPEQVKEAKGLLDATSHTTLGLLEQSQKKHVADMAAVSPQGRLAGMTVPVYLLHGEGDNIIPSAETAWMAEELPKRKLEARLISPVLSHLNLDGKGPGVVDRVRLVHFFALVLHRAEGGTFKPSLWRWWDSLRAMKH